MSDRHGDGMEPLRREHGELIPHIEQLRRTANSVGITPVDQVRRAVEEAHEFLTHHLIPHAQAEDRVLYPAVGRLLGAPLATATMSRDHVAIRELADELGRLGQQVGGQELARTLMTLQVPADRRGAGLVLPAGLDQVAAVVLGPRDGGDVLEGKLPAPQS